MIVDLGMVLRLIVLVLLAVITRPVVAHRRLESALTDCVFNQPFSATETLDYDPLGRTSELLSLHRESRLYRDSQGRMRKEFNYRSQPMAVFLEDCVTGVWYSWNVGDTSVVRWKVKHIDPTVDKTTAPEDQRNEGDWLVIGGVKTHHSRSVKATDGMINELIESWYAPTLGLNLAFVYYRADEGTTTIRISNLNMAEPAATLFQLPKNIEVKDNVLPTTGIPRPQISFAR